MLAEGPGFGKVGTRTLLWFYSYQISVDRKCHKSIYQLTVCVRISHYHYAMIYPAITKMVLIKFTFVCTCTKIRLVNAKCITGLTL